MDRVEQKAFQEQLFLKKSYLVKIGSCSSPCQKNKKKRWSDGDSGVHRNQKLSYSSAMNICICYSQSLLDSKHSIKGRFHFLFPLFFFFLSWRRRRRSKSETCSFVYDMKKKNTRTRKRNLFDLVIVPQLHIIYFFYKQYTLVIIFRQKLPWSQGHENKVDNFLKQVWAKNTILFQVSCHTVH